MSRTPTVVFANFVCRFGDTLVLLDLVQEVVIPAFLDVELLRSYGQTDYFFHQVRISTQFLQNGSRTLAIHGRFVKNTILTRTQIFELGRLVPDEEEMRSAPSAYFVLLLHNHKVIYFPETPHAPPLSAFSTTAAQFIRQKHRLFIDTRYQELRETDAPRTKRELYIDFPSPNVHVMPLASRSSVDEFLEKFEVLKSVEVQLLETNQEFTQETTMRMIRGMKDRIGAKSTKLVHSNSDGLNKAQAAEQIHAAAAAGNHHIKIKGTGEGGTKLSGDNEEFKLEVAARDIPTEPNRRAASLTSIYESSREQGIISEDVQGDNTVRIAALREDLDVE